jgi:hypothetical protein
MGICLCYLAFREAYGPRKGQSPLVDSVCFYLTSCPNYCGQRAPREKGCHVQSLCAVSRSSRRAPRAKLLHLKCEAKDRLSVICECKLGSERSDVRLGLDREYGFASWRAQGADIKGRSNMVGVEDYRSSHQESSEGLVFA